MAYLTEVTSHLPDNSKQARSNWLPFSKSKLPVWFIKGTLLYSDKRVDFICIYIVKNHYWTTKQNLICLDKVINSIFWAFHKKSTWTYLSLRTKTHEHLRVGGELILFCFSKLKLKYFLYLSLHSSVYDSKSHKVSKFAL